MTSLYSFGRNALLGLIFITNISNNDMGFIFS